MSDIEVFRALDVSGREGEAFKMFSIKQYFIYKIEMTGTFMNDEEDRGVLNNSRGVLKSFLQGENAHYVNVDE